MRDDYLSREWAGSHHRFSDSIAALLDTLRVSLARLHAENFDAPWKRERRFRCG